MSTTPRDCPRCRGTLEPAWRGEHRDKFLQCEYCGFLVDVPDEHTVERSESEEFTDDRGIRVKRVTTVRHTRRDLAGELEGVDEGGGLEFPSEIDLGGAKLELTLVELPNELLSEIPPELARAVQKEFIDLSPGDGIQSALGKKLFTPKGWSSEYRFDSEVECPPTTFFLDDSTDMPLAPRYDKLFVAVGVGAALAVAVMMMLF